MYQATSTAHRIAHDLLTHPRTARLGGTCMYESADSEYPAEVSIEFANGTGLYIFDRNDKANIVDVQSYSATETISSDTIAGDTRVSEDMWFQTMLDDAVSLALRAHSA